MRIIAGTARSRTVIAPEGRDTRPTLDRVRENLFNILLHRVMDSRVLDLFAGSGALALEAVSRGATMAVMVDHDGTAHRIQQQNVEALGFVDQTRLIRADWRSAVTTLAREHATFDLVFLDPPYAMTEMAPVMEALRPLLAPEAVIVLEHEARHMPHTAEGFRMTDNRKYGYVGVSFFACEA